ncbi:MAG: methyltransferase domain-containing protein, partial [Planctomycetes bacterium]|nr:methyltransferase domain-containing protein [Planctomycetota bacterium]
MDRTNTARMVLIGAVLVVGGAIAVWYWPPPTTNGGPKDDEQGFGDERLVYEARSKYSHIKITRNGTVYTMWFVRDNRDEVIESQVNLKSPHDLLISYTKYMFLSYAFRPKQEKVLIVGLGGGSMVHFLKAYDSNCKVDVVEIDPEVVKIADRYFGVKTAGNVRIITQDAFDLLSNTDQKYDVIYMDAFLKPDAKTDETGTPLKLKTL